MHYFLKFIFGIKIYMFRTAPLSTIRSFSLYAQQWYMSYSFVDSLRAAGSGWNCNSVLILLASGSGLCVPLLSQAFNRPVWHIPLTCVQWETPDDGQRNCPKRVEFYSKNKFEKLVHLVDFIIRNTKRPLITEFTEPEGILNKILSPK